MADKLEEYHELPYITPIPVEEDSKNLEQAALSRLMDSRHKCKSGED